MFILFKRTPNIYFQHPGFLYSDLNDISQRNLINDEMQKISFDTLKTDLKNK